jgi:hypothetical protein
MSSISLRIKDLIDLKKLNISSFEKKIDAGNNSIGTIIKRNSNVSGEILSKILNTFLDVNAEWLITGKGEMIKSTGLNAAAEQTEIFEKSAPAIKLDPIDELITMQKKEINRLEKEISRLEIELADCLEQKKHTKVIK